MENSAFIPTFDWEKALQMFVHFFISLQLTGQRTGHITLSLQIMGKTVVLDQEHLFMKASMINLLRKLEIWQLQEKLVTLTNLTLTKGHR